MQFSNVDSDSYHVPDPYPTCDQCGKLATAITFLSEQLFIASLDCEGHADKNHCKPVGLPEDIGYDSYYCDSCKPPKD